MSDRKVRARPGRNTGILLLSLSSHWTAIVVDCLVVVATLRRKLVRASPGSNGRESQQPTQYNIDHNILITQRETLRSDRGIDKS